MNANSSHTGWIPWALSIALVTSSSARATDVDGPDDCQRTLIDFGDAPEDFIAYPAVSGHFPTCLFLSAPGTQELACAPISTPPGLTGHVTHTSPPNGYWLGCPPAGGLPSGVDSENDGKSSAGGPTSICAQIAVDCIEPTIVGPFGQDECFGDSDAGLAVLPTFDTCGSATVTFNTYNCDTIPRDVFLNVLVDMNADGDWNDNFDCPSGCAYEWGVKNATITLLPKCAVITSPSFLVGPNAGPAWMRISISDEPALDDFPWAGSANMGTGTIKGGETEDYVVEIRDNLCDAEILDFGDAPEGITAYPSGVVGLFPTCVAPGGLATPDVSPLCPSGILPPGPAGFVQHLKAPDDPLGFWLGCAPASADFVDSEPDGKVNLTPPAGTPSACDNVTPTDCVEIGAFGVGLDFGQDECFGDGVDAGLVGGPSIYVFDGCRAETVTVVAYNCLPDTIQVFLNILVDWNEDGDWIDTFYCEGVDRCAPEWATQNQLITLPPGCSNPTDYFIQAGPFSGFGWMRISLSEQAAPLDFPWNGTAGMPGQAFVGGETEDYPISIVSAVGATPAPHGNGVWLADGAPNPSASASTIRFGLVRGGAVRLDVYDVTGRHVRTLVQDVLPAGTRTVSWDFTNDGGEKVSPGVYLVRLEAGDQVRMSKVTRIR